jgi:hypothetical protein
MKKPQTIKKPQIKKTPQKFFPSLVASMKRLPGICVAPRNYFATVSAPLWDGGIVFVVLFLVTFAQKLLWVDPGKARLTVWWALEQSFMNSLLAWSIFFSLFFTLLTILRKPVTLVGLAGQVGAAGMPLVVATLLSDVLWLLVLAFPGFSSLPYWLTLHQILAWAGLLLSWPGLYGYYLLRDGYKIKQLWAVLLPGVASLVISIANIIVLLAK